MRFINSNSLTSTIYNSAVTYPAPVNISYLWKFGIFSLVCLVIQIITGIFLAMHYIPDTGLAFSSVEHIMRDVNYGWLLRYTHANGASMFFIVVYIHLFRGLYFSSYVKPRELLWCVGVVILLIMILTAFLGYVLPWGQMSFWAATVITNFASALPYVGGDLVQWIWGGFSVDSPTLNRFFSLHYLFPFIIVALVIVHIIFLHENRSNNPLGIKAIDWAPFTPHFTVKDLYAVVLFFIFFSLFVFFAPNLLGHPDNYIAANPMSTPEHIVPEWYFLPFYAILRTVPDKLGGVCILLASIFILILLPYIHEPNIKSFVFRPLSQFIFWFFIVDFILLGWIGGKIIENPFIFLGRLFTFFYFFYFIFLLYIINYIEKNMWLNKKI